MQSIDDIVATLSVTTHTLPAEALRQARERWPDIAERILDGLRAALVNPSEAEQDLAFYGLYLAAQARDPRAFPLICALAHHPTRLDELISDGATEDLTSMLVRTFDGDFDCLKALVEDDAADEFIRHSAFQALAWLTADGRLSRDAMRDYLIWLHANGQPQQELNYVWAGWLDTVAALGFAEFVPQVMGLYARRLVSKRDIQVDEFKQALATAQSASDPFAAFDPHIRRRIEQLDDVVSLLATWASFQPGADEEEDIAPAEEPYVNPHRNVGRNDPCPCGSGKKFKKCCLAA